MHGQLADIFFRSDDQKTFIYYEGIPLSYFMTMHNIKITILTAIFGMITLEYGIQKETLIEAIGTKKSHLGSESSSVFLHPILRFYNKECISYLSNNLTFFPSYKSLNSMKGLIDEFHLDENLLADFRNEMYLTKIKRYIGIYFTTI
jgi:hypothetical protein